VRDFAFGTLRLPRLVSLIQPGNPASERVAQKVGLTNTGRIERDERAYLGSYPLLTVRFTRPLCLR